MNGLVVDILAGHGQDAPVNRRVVEVAFEIEKGIRDAKLEKSALLVDAMTAAEIFR